MNHFNSRHKYILLLFQYFLTKMSQQNSQKPDFFLQFLLKDAHQKIKIFPHVNIFVRSHKIFLMLCSIHIKHPYERCTIRSDLWVNLNNNGWFYGNKESVKKLPAGPVAACLKSLFILQRIFFSQFLIVPLREKVRIKSNKILCAKLSRNLIKKIYIYIFWRKICIPKIYTISAKIFMWSDV